jgi:Spy/CpxP family protein refolding chaperone
MKKRDKLGLAGIGLAGAVTVGALAAGAMSAQAASTPSATATSGSTTDASEGGHTANGITETALTGDVAAKVEAAVKAAYPDATIERMETDADGAKYEAHIVQADGTEATVKLDASFAVTGTETGHGGRHHDADDTDADADSDTSSS